MLRGTAPVRRPYVIAALLFAIGPLGYLILQRVVRTVFLAVTVAYVLAGV